MTNTTRWMMGTCSGFIKGSVGCKHGHYQTPACDPGKVACPLAPFCVNEDAPLWTLGPPSKEQLPDSAHQVYAKEPT